MANLLTSTQCKVTTAPQYYTNYLSNLANAGQTAQQNAQFVCAQPLQTKAFAQACQNYGAFQPGVTAGQNLVGQAANQNVTGAAAPYLQAGTSASPLCAARPMICSAANLNLGCVATQYMSPYLKTAVQNLSDVGHRNIMQNLSPMATAAAVGSGQYGSQRGAQVLGQVQAQAEQCLNKQIADMSNTAYGSALQAAGTKETALSNLANTTSMAQQAQNTANLTAGQYAAQAASNQGQLLNTAGTNLGQLAKTGACMNLACVNALSSLGGQQQTIAQNKQNYPLTTLSSLSSLLQGYNVPVGTQTSLNMSPLSAAAAIGSGTMGMLQNQIDPKTGQPIQNSSQLYNMYNTAKDIYGRITSNNSPSIPASEPYFSSTPYDSPDDQTAAKGGLIKAKKYKGCASTQSRGALPYRKG
jgi:hypothetical protein